MRDHAEYRSITASLPTLECNQRSEQKAMRDEGTRAVDWIEHPTIAAAFLDAVLFTDDRMLWVTLLDQGAHRGLGIPVGQRDRACVALHGHLCAAEEKRANRSEGFCNQLVHERHELALIRP